MTLRDKLTAALADSAEASVEEQVTTILETLELDPVLTDRELRGQLYRGRRGLAAIDDSTREIISGMLIKLRPDLSAKKVDSLTESLLTEVFDTPDFTPAQ